LSDILGALVSDWLVIEFEFDQRRIVFFQAVNVTGLATAATKARFLKSVVQHNKCLKQGWEILLPTKID
jgi:hypothetical protein